MSIVILPEMILELVKMENGGRGCGSGGNGRKLAHLAKWSASSLPGKPTCALMWWKRVSELRSCSCCCIASVSSLNGVMAGVLDC